MQLYYGFEEFPKNVATVVTVGSFDGVHSGHIALLERVQSLASRLKARSVVVTFDPHPRIAMGRAEGMRLLTTVEERAALLMRAGIDYVVVARFDEQFRSQSFDNFVRESLVAKLGMRGLVVGYNHRLGRGNEGRYETLLPIADACGFILERVEQHLVIGSKVSSTVVRTQLEAGNIGVAAELLGHPYIIYGVAHAGVVEIGDEYKLLPADGLYRATLLYGDEKTAIDDECVSIERDVVLLGKPLDGKVEIVLTDRV